MAPLTTLIGRFIRRQGGPILDLPDVSIPLPRPTPSTTERSPATRPTPAESTVTSSTVLPTSTSASVDPSANSSPAASSPTTQSRTLAPTSTVPTTTSTTAPNPVIVVETAAASTTGGVSNANTTAAPSATGLSVVVESKTVTGSVPNTTSSSLPNQAGATRSNSFLENKVASGIVFGLCGLVGLLLIFLIILFAMRKRRQIKQLEKEIISFDPEDIGRFHQRRPDDDTASIDSLEKGRRSGSSLGQYAGNGYASTMNVDNGDYRNAAPYVDYRPQRAPTIQRPANMAFNPVARSDTTYRTYAMPSQTYNQ